jgi:hypothetical protein
VRRRVTWHLLASCVLVQGCGAGWRRQSDAVLTNPEPRQQVQVWQGGRVERWHALQVSPDSISGVPYLAAIDCDTCRITLARGVVDSVRYGNLV